MEYSVNKNEGDRGTDTNRLVVNWRVKDWFSIGVSASLFLFTLYVSLFKTQWRDPETVFGVVILWGMSLLSAYFIYSYLNTHVSRLEMDELQIRGYGFFGKVQEFPWSEIGLVTEEKSYGEGGKDDFSYEIELINRRTLETMKINYSNSQRYAHIKEFIVRKCKEGKTKYQDMAEANSLFLW